MHCKTSRFVLVHGFPAFWYYASVCVGVCTPASVHQPASVFVFLCFHMCTGHG